jgi:hypothetical protein
MAENYAKYRVLGDQKIGVTLSKQSKFQLSDSVRVEHIFQILDVLPANMVMALDICKRLPLREMLV